MAEFGVCGLAEKHQTVFPNVTQELNGMETSQGREEGDTRPRYPERSWPPRWQRPCEVQPQAKRGWQRLTLKTD